MTSIEKEAKMKKTAKLIYLTIIALIVLSSYTQGGAVEIIVSYSYDKLNRLTGASYQLSNDQPNIYYQYDRLGNITEYLEMNSLGEALLCLQIVAGLHADVSGAFINDINDDGMVGIEEAIHAIQIVSGLRK